MLTSKPAMVNSIITAIQDRFPQAQVDLDDPPRNPDGVWNIDVLIDTSDFVVEYWPGNKTEEKLALSLMPVPFGIGADHIFHTTKELLEKMASLVGTTKEEM